MFPSLIYIEIGCIAANKSVPSLGTSTDSMHLQHTKSETIYPCTTAYFSGLNIDNNRDRPLPAVGDGKLTKVDVRETRGESSLILSKF